MAVEKNKLGIQTAKEKTYRFIFKSNKLQSEVYKMLRTLGFHLVQFGKILINKRRSKKERIYLTGAISNNPNYKKDFTKDHEVVLRVNPNAEIVAPIEICSYLPESSP